MAKINMKKKIIIKELHLFEEKIGMAELNALSKVSLERRLSDKEFQRMMELKKRLLKVI